VNRIKGEPGGRTVAVATANGLALFDRSRRLGQVLDRKTGLIASHTTDILFRRTSSGESSLVVATPAGLSFIQNGSISSLYAFQGLVNNHVYTIAERGDDLLAGTLGGFSILRNGLITASYTTANSGLRQNWITASAVDGASIYLGTYGDGVVRLTPQNSLEPFVTVEGRGERVEINPNALLVTAKGVYAGTAGQGLAVLRKGSGRWHAVRDGLPSGNVTALAERNSLLYIGTDNGLVAIPESELP
jgi:ligand-binding sensor domain-containing protein